MENFEELFSYNNLYHSFLECRKNQVWKDSVIRFSNNYAEELFLLQKQLMDGTYTSYPDRITFIHERGKVRKIHSQHIRDRIVHKIINQKILKPTFHKMFIYTNFASQDKKGMSLALRTFKCHLNRAYRKWGKDFYILAIDMKSYFESIPHDYIKKFLYKKIKDERIMKLCLEPMKSYPNGRGLGLGSEINQTYALLCLDEFDHIIKERFHIKEYGRYMDDMYLFSDSKELLLDILKFAENYFNQIGLQMNQKKTNFFPVKNGITFIGYRWRITDTGHVLLIPKKQTVVRNKRKLRKYKRNLDSGRFQYKEIENSYKAMRQNYKRCNVKSSLEQMDRYYNDIFIKGGYWIDE